MAFSKEEIQQLSQLLLSADESNSILALVMLEGQDKPPMEIFTELFCIAQSDKSSQETKERAIEQFAKLASPKEVAVARNKRRSFGRYETSTTKNLKRFKREIPRLDNIRMAKYVYKAFKVGYKFFLSTKDKDAQRWFFEQCCDPDKKVIDFSNLRIKNIKQGIFEIETLEALRFLPEDITAIPKEIVKLKNLRELTLKVKHNHYWNFVKRLPKEFVELKKLEKLEFPLDPKVPFPKEILELETLEYLRLGSEKVEQIPPYLSHLKNLKHLYLPSSIAKKQELPT